MTVDREQTRRDEGLEPIETEDFFGRGGTDYEHETAHRLLTEVDRLKAELGQAERFIDERGQKLSDLTRRVEQAERMREIHETANQRLATMLEQAERLYRERYDWAMDQKRKAEARAEQAERERDEARQDRNETTAAIERANAHIETQSARLVKADTLAEAQTLRIVKLDAALRQCQNTGDTYVYKIAAEALAASEQEQKP